MSTITTKPKPLEMHQGEHKTLLIKVYDAAGLLQDITNFKVFFTLKKRYDDVTPLIAKKSPTAGGPVGEITIATPQATATNKGIARAYLLPADTTALKVESYVCDTWVEDLAGIRTDIDAERDFILKPRVTVIVP